MIISLSMKNFRKVEDEVMSFTKGLNLFRGPNESSKSTRLEAILFALYGSRTLRDPLANTVTWGKKESDLRVELVIEVSGTVYTFNRAKSGAEVLTNGKVLVTGQNEVTAFAAQLLGADAKTAASLMMADQSGLRGALDEGPAAVSGLMSKLADFDLIDRIVENMQSTMLLGSDMPIRERLADAEKEVEAAKSAMPSEGAITALNNLVQKTQLELKKHNDVRTSTYGPAYNATSDALREANAKVEARDALVVAVDRAKSKLADAVRNLDDAKAKATVPVDYPRIAVLKSEIADVEAARVRRAAYDAFLRLPKFPETHWVGTKAEFDAKCKSLDDAMRIKENVLRSLHNDIKLLEKDLVTGGVCPTCGTDISKRDDIVLKNQQTQEAIEGKRRLILKEEASLADVKSVVAGLGLVMLEANKLVLRGSILQHISLDEGFYPPKVSWVGAIPSEAQSPDALKKELDALEAVAKSVTQAEGMVVAYTRAHEQAKHEYVDAAARLEVTPEIDMAPLLAAHSANLAALDLVDNAIYDLNKKLENLEAELALITKELNDCKNRHDIAASRVVEYSADIKKIAFNNGLLKKMRGLKPSITDHLWGSVLAAVSNFFTQLRGENSVVTKDSSGFKVNGYGVSSLSGSTLDILALAVRVALTKTFIPHVDVLILDEPAYGCDSDRTASMLGFLSSVGFEQVLIASHDILSESVADNVIELGV